jgi:hypothetical protein
MKNIRGMVIKKIVGVDPKFADPIPINTNKFLFNNKISEESI